MNNINKFILLATALGVTAVLTMTVDKYQITSGELLSNRSFEQGLKDWKIDGTPSLLTVENGSLLIEIREPGKNIEIEQSINLTGPGFILLEGELKSRGVIPGTKPWHRARLDFSRYGSNGKWLSLPHNVASLVGSNEWQHYQEVFRLVDGVDKNFVAIQMLSATGELWVRNLSLHRVVPANTYIVIRSLLFLMWAAILIMLFNHHVMGGEGKLFGMAIGLAVILIVIGTMLPASFKASFQGGIKEFVFASENHLEENFHKRDSVAVGDQSEQIYLAGNLEIGKVGHFVFFALLGFLILVRKGEGLILVKLAEITALAAATELMQFFVEGRTPLLADFFTDTAGVGTGALIYLVFVLRRKPQSLLS